MISFAHLWLPILLSAIGVFIASSILHMLLKFWHGSDYAAFSNEDEVRAAIRHGSPTPGIYALPHCTMESMKTPEGKEKFATGPVGLVILRANGMPAIGGFLALWFVYSLVVSYLCAMLAGMTLTVDTDLHRVFHVVALAAFLAYALRSVPAGIWEGHPWKAVAKDVVDGLIYAIVTAAVFAWLWPTA
jgi:hypothetical protein